MQERVKRLQEVLIEEDLDGILINNPQNRRYLTGFTGTAGSLLVTEDKAVLITDFRYTNQAKGQAPYCEVIEFKDSSLEVVNEIIQREGLNTLAFEGDFESYNTYLKYKDKLKVKLNPTKGLVKKLRLVKDDGEIEKLKEAIKITDQAFEHILDYIEVGKVERDIALELEFFMKKRGATDNAFDFIVASGERSALPHGVAGEKKVQKGDLLTMDFGCVYGGYNSDMTRTVVVGEAPTDKQKEVYYRVLKAQEEAIKGIRVGMKGSEVDKIARDIITQAGYGDYFGHGLGHGVGLEIHEGPRLSPKGDITLEEGMVVTVEPGIYLPDWGGVRIEDIVVVTENGCENLSNSPKELIVIED